MTKATRTSQRKAEANRRNASKSTGPRTAQGKSWSRLNALKHGILASQVVIATIEGRAARKLFEATVEGLAQDFQPVGTYEQLLVQEIAACFWRQRRLHAFENRAAFQVLEHPVSLSIKKPAEFETLVEPVFTAGGKLTTAEHVYEKAGLDGITLPNAADTMRVIRYEAAINRTRERAVQSLRAMKQARGHRAVRAQIAPAVDRAAAQRNASSLQARVLAPLLSANVWRNLVEVYSEADEAREADLRARMEGRPAGAAENDQTKPKTLSPEEQARRVRQATWQVFAGRDAPEEPADASTTPPADPDKPPST